MLFLLIKFKNTLLIKLRKDLANKAIQEEEIIAIGDKTKEEIADLLGKIEIEKENLIIKNIMILQVKMKRKEVKDIIEMVQGNTEEEVNVVEVVVEAIEEKTEVVEIIEIEKKIEKEIAVILNIQDRINHNATIKETITTTIEKKEAIVVIIMNIDSTSNRKKDNIKDTKMKNNTKEDNIDLNKIDLEIVI